MLIGGLDSNLLRDAMQPHYIIYMAHYVHRHFRARMYHTIYLLFLGNGEHLLFINQTIWHNCFVSKCHSWSSYIIIYRNDITTFFFCFLYNWNL